MNTILSRRLLELGLDLPRSSAPAANYIPTVRGGGLLFVAGQVPQLEGRVVHVGRVGVDLTIEQGQEAARLCALNILAQLDTALQGHLERLTNCLRIGGFVRCDEAFAEQSKVLNGASDLLFAALGERGRHARTAVGVASLPRGAAVEVDAIFAVED